MKTPKQVSEMDQAIMGLKDMATMHVAYYNQLRKLKMDRKVALTLTLGVVTSQVTEAMRCKGH